MNRRLKKIYNIIPNIKKGILNNPGMVLTYHRINELEHDAYELCVSEKNFYEQLKFLKSNFNMVFASDIFAKSDKQNVAITFDDGYADNYYNALPILEELAIPATIFITTKNIDTNKEFWDDHLARIMQGELKHDKLEITCEGNNFSWDNSRYSNTNKFFKEVHKLLKTMRNEEQKSFLEQLQVLFAPKTIYMCENNSMSSDELRMLSKSEFIRIGAHTVTHTRLSTQDRVEQLWEIKSSKAFIENVIGKNINVFSYPFGSMDDYNQDSIAVAKQLGFGYVFANFKGKVYLDTDVYQIPRITVKDWSITEFKQKMFKYRYFI